MLDSNTVDILRTIALVLITAFMGYLKVKDMTKLQQQQLFREEIYKLFLEAEKRGWIGAEKMTWCTEQVYAKFPEQIKTFIKEEAVEVWMQDRYDEFKEWLRKNQLQPEVKPEVVQE